MAKSLASKFSPGPGTLSSSENEPNYCSHSSVNSPTVQRQRRGRTDLKVPGCGVWKPVAHPDPRTVFHGLSQLLGQQPVCCPFEVPFGASVSPSITGRTGLDDLWEPPDLSSGWSQLFRRCFFPTMGWKICSPAVCCAGDTLGQRETGQGQE